MADESGTIGKAYGYQVGKRYKHHKYKEGEGLEQLKEYPSAVMKDGYVELDQMDAVLYDLKHTPFGRRIMISLWNFEDLHAMGLQPCCWNITFNVTDEHKDKLVLNMILNQRSQDTLAANNWNVVQYSILLMMVAQAVDMIPGELVHMLADMHIYDRHVDTIKELISREQYEAPVVTLNPEVKNFYDFTTNDITVEGYKAGEQVHFEVAE
jgi:thymidylate synthase